MIIEVRVKPYEAEAIEALVDEGFYKSPRDFVYKAIKEKFIVLHNNMKNTIKCPTCKGTRFINVGNGDLDNCEPCKGTGRIPKSHENERKMKGKGSVYECDECLGVFLTLTERIPECCPFCKTIGVKQEETKSQDVKQ